MSFLFILLVVCLSFLHVQSCSKTFDDFNPIITDIFLNNDDSALLTLQIEGKSFTTCRELDTSTKTLAFMDASCNAASYSWTDIQSTSTIVDVRSSNGTLTIEFLDSEMELELNVEYYIHPSFYAWFYSANEDVLFIFTSTMNATQNMSETAEITTDDLVVIFVAFNPNQNTSETKEYAVGTLPWTDVFSAENNLVGDEDSWVVYFDSTEMYNYDGLYIVQLPGMISCVSTLYCFSLHAFFVKTYDLFSVFIVCLRL